MRGSARGKIIALAVTRLLPGRVLQSSTTTSAHLSLASVLLPLLCDGVEQLAAVDERELDTLVLSLRGVRGATGQRVNGEKGNSV